MTAPISVQLVGALADLLGGGVPNSSKMTSVASRSWALRPSQWDVQDTNELVESSGLAQLVAVSPVLLDHLPVGDVLSVARDKASCAKIAATKDVCRTPSLVPIAW